jgi:hypothetical protein
MHTSEQTGRIKIFRSPDERLRHPGNAAPDFALGLIRATKLDTKQGLGHQGKLGQGPDERLRHPGNVVPDFALRLNPGYETDRISLEESDVSGRQGLCRLHT